MDRQRRERDIYIYIERERERQADGDTKRGEAKRIDKMPSKTSQAEVT